MGTMRALSDKAVIGRIVLSFLIAAVVAYIVQAVPISFRRLLIGPAVVTAPELGALEIFVGFLNSLIVSTVCLLILRRPVIHVTTGAVIAQILWVEWAYGFRQGGETFAVAILRYTEHVGVILGAVVAAYLYARVSSRNRSVAT